MPERTIEVVDARIHSGYRLIDYEDLPISPAYRQIMELWDQRLMENYQNPNYIALYFSAYFRHNPNDFPRLIPVDLGKGLKDEIERIEKAWSLLGERFFMFAGADEPHKYSLNPQLKVVGFRIDPNTTRLVAYGEYYELCVEKWGKKIQEAFGLPDQACSYPIELSLTRDQYREMLAEHRARLLLARYNYLPMGFHSGRNLLSKIKSAIP